MRILIHEWVTGGGMAGTVAPSSWKSEGGTIRRALVKEFSSLEDVEVVETLDARYADEAKKGRSVIVSAGEEETICRRLAATCDATILVAPETDGILERRARWVEASGGASLGSSADAIALASDKHRLARLWTDQGVTTPRTRLFRTKVGWPRDIGFPAVVKPVDGAGSIHTYYLSNTRGLPSLAEMPEAMLLQDFQPGLPMSASFLVGREGTIRLLAAGWQEFYVKQGRFAYRGGRLPAPGEIALGTPKHALRAVPGLAGWVGVDFVLSADGTEVHVLEINPRPTTSVVGLTRYFPPGAMARAWIEMLQGKPADSPLFPREECRGKRIRFTASGNTEIIENQP